MTKRRTEKVVCYVVREGHLLTIRHLDVPLEHVGIQVPAGTIKAGESPSAAALREATEETGLQDLRVVRPLGESEYDITPYRHEIMHRHFFELTTDLAVGDPWTAGEPDPEGDGPPIAWACEWIPLERAHVLSGGLSSMVWALHEH